MSIQQTTASNPKPLGHPRNGVRLYREDEVAIADLVGEIKGYGFQIDTLSIIRECVHQGLPATKDRWAVIMAATTKE